MTLRKVNTIPIERDGTMPSPRIRNQEFRQVPKITAANPESHDGKPVASSVESFAIRRP